MATAQRELERELIDLGYKPESRGKHQAFRHPTAGLLIVPSSVGRGRGSANLVAVAKRKIRQANSDTGRFVNYLCELYDIPRDGSKKLKLNVSEEIRNWMDREPGGDRLNPTSLLTMARQHPQVVVLPKPKGAHFSLWEIRGKDFIAPESEVVTKEETEQPMAQVVDLRPEEPQEAPGAPEGIERRRDVAPMLSTLETVVEKLSHEAAYQEKVELAISTLENVGKQIEDTLTLLRSR